MFTQPQIVVCDQSRGKKKSHRKFKIVPNRKFPNYFKIVNKTNFRKKTEQGDQSFEFTSKLQIKGSASNNNSLLMIKLPTKLSGIVGGHRR